MAQTKYIAVALLATILVSGCISQITGDSEAEFIMSENLQLQETQVEVITEGEPQESAITGMITNEGSEDELAIVSVTPYNQEGQEISDEMLDETASTTIQPGEEWEFELIVESGNVDDYEIYIADREFMP